MYQRYRRYENIEFIIPANNTALRIQFPDIPQLRSDVTKEILIRQIEVFAAGECPDSFNQNPLLTVEDLSKCFLTLYVDDEESIFRIPLLRLRNIYEGVGSDQTDNSFWTSKTMCFDNLSVNWTKSYITLSETLTTSALSSILFGIGYIRVVPGTYAKIQQQRLLAQNAGIIDQM